MRIGLNLTEIPEQEHVAIPMRWEIATMWWRSPEDGTTKFEQRIELVGPNESVLLANVAKILLADADTHRHITRIQGFPVPKVAGRCFLRLYLREDRDGTDWGKPVAIYPMTIAVDLQAPKEPA